MHSAEMIMKIESPFLLIFALLVFYFSGAQSTFLQLPSWPHALESLNHSRIENLGACSYTVVITTSCVSTAATQDHISIAFGDERGRKVVGSKINNAEAGTFERCNTDMFLIRGPCTNRACSVYLYRAGPDGWVPESVQVYSCFWRPVTFYYNTLIPDKFWYGYNMCTSGVAPSIIGGHGRSFMSLVSGIVVSALLSFSM